MSILIKGVEMPKDGELLCINIHPDGKVCINLDLECEKVGEAVPVPAHGRLGDLDKLADSFDPSDFWNPDAEDNCFAAIHVVNCAPTIIPAEPPKDESPTGPYDLLYEEGGPDA